MAASSLRRRIWIAGMGCTAAVSAITVLHALWQIGVKSALYLGGLHGPDATLYWTMGRVIQNGLTLYTDVFDPKPPGMFLLSALSQSLTGDGSIGFILNVLILITIPLLFLCWGWRESQGMARTPRMAMLLFATMTGLCIALYNATIGGDWQTEYYGAFLGLLYVASIHAWLRKPSAIAVAGACVSFSIALLLKEPFLLALTAVAVLFLQTKGQWLRLWVLPLLSACATYTIVLVSLGAFHSYIFIYLQGMLGGYIQRGGPVWIRGLVAWERVWTNVLDFSALFPLFVAALIAWSLPRAETRREIAWRWTAVAAVFGILLLGRSFSPVALPWEVGTMAAGVVAGMGGVAMAVMAFGGRDARAARLYGWVGRTWRHGVALYLTLTAIGLGADFHGQYFALAIPFYAALFLLLYRKTVADNASPHAAAAPMTVTLIASLTLLTSVPFVHPPSTVAGEIAKMQATERANRADAAMLDAILDACGIDRYFFVEDRAYMPYARHSPFNFYLYTRLEHLPRYHPIYRTTDLERLERAEIVVLGKPYVPMPRPGNSAEEAMGRRVQDILRQRFISQLPACADALPVPEGYALLFPRRP